MLFPPLIFFIKAEQSQMKRRGHDRLLLDADAAFCSRPNLFLKDFIKRSPADPAETQGDKDL